MKVECVVDYEELLAEYETSLTTVLRGFRVGPDFLETWVPDEDVRNGVVDLIEAAAEAGVKSVEVRLGATASAELDSEDLERLLRPFGDTEVSRNATDVLSVRVTGLGMAEARLDEGDHAQQASPVASTLPRRNTDTRTNREDFAQVVRPNTGVSVYEKALLDRAKRADKKVDSTPLESANGTIGIEARVDHIVLFAHVESKSRRVIVVSHSGASSTIEEQLFRELHNVMLGRTIQDCSDHAVLRLEHVLRPVDATPVTGIVGPECADRIFDLPLKLVRELMDVYRRQVDYWEVDSDDSPELTSGWRELSEEARCERLAGKIETIAPGDVRLQRLEESNRVYVQFSAESNAATHQACLMRLERALQDELEPTLQVFVAPAVDHNKLRRKGLADA